MGELRVWAPDGMPEVRAGDDLVVLVGAALAADGAAHPGHALVDGDVVVVTSKVVSKAEGRAVAADDREQAITDETVRVVATRSHAQGVTRIVENRLGLVMAAAGVDASNTPDGAHRVLLFVVPGLAWRDLDGKDGKALPHLRRLTGQSAVANLSSRAPKLRSDLASGYVTLGAGNKAVGVGPTDDGSGLQPDGAAFEAGEAVGGQPAGAVFGRRTGRPTDRGLVHLGIAETIGANRDSSFGAEVGALGDSLADAGWSRAVIANGDGTDIELANEAADRRHRT